METFILFAVIVSVVISAVTLYKVAKIEKSRATHQESSDSRTEDELYEQAKAAALQAGAVSASFLQRRLRIGYARAARLLDILEDNGIIEAARGGEPRRVIVDENVRARRSV